MDQVQAAAAQGPTEEAAALAALVEEGPRGQREGEQLQASLDDAGPLPCRMCIANTPHTRA